MSPLWFLLLLVILFTALVMWDVRRRRHVIREHQRMERQTILGDFEHDGTDANSKFIFTGKDTFVQHKMGTSTSLDQTWRYDKDQQRYINAPLQYAILQRNVLTIYEEGTDTVLDRLVRYKIECPCFTNVKPTRKNEPTLYDTCRVQEDQSDAFASLLKQKKKCIVFHDWNLSENMELVSQGVFMVDKKRTCFFYVPDYLYPFYSIKEASVGWINVDELSPLLFAGVLIE